MKNKSAYKCVLAMLILFSLLVSFSLSSYAYSLKPFVTDSTTRWSYVDPGLRFHRGTKSASYKYSSPDVKAKYSGYVKRGISLWGSSISCTENSSSTVGLIKTEDYSLNATAATTIKYDSSMHIKSWTIVIYKNNFDAENHTDAGRDRTIAHEIGHAYGLGHVNNSSQIMYTQYSATKNVTSYDKNGMNVMTHAHGHNGTYSAAIQQISGHSHITRCNTCKAYYDSTCTYSDYHAGSNHVFQFNCKCGNKQLMSWPCNGNPCVKPFAHQHHYQTR